MTVYRTPETRLNVSPVVNVRVLCIVLAAMAAQLSQFTTVPSMTSGRMDLRKSSITPKTESRGYIQLTDQNNPEQSLVGIEEICLTRSLLRSLCHDGETCTYHDTTEQNTEILVRIKPGTRCARCLFGIA